MGEKEGLKEQHKTTAAYLLAKQMDILENIRFMKTSLEQTDKKLDHSQYT